MYHPELDIEIPDKQYLRPDEVADLMDVTTRTVRNILGRGELDYVMFGGQYRIPTNGLIDYLVYKKAEEA